MRIIRSFLAVAFLTVALVAVSTPAAYGTPLASARGDVTVTVTGDATIPAGQYQLGLNSSLTDRKSTGGFSLLGPVFVGGRTVLYCERGDVTIIVNEVNPPKKNSYDFLDRYLVIYVQDNPDEVAFLGLNSLPTCATVPTVDPTIPVDGDIQIR